MLLLLLTTAFMNLKIARHCYYCAVLVAGCGVAVPRSCCPRFLNDFEISTYSNVKTQTDLLRNLLEGRTEKFKQLATQRLEVGTTQKYNLKSTSAHTYCCSFDGLMCKEDDACVVKIQHKFSSSSSFLSVPSPCAADNQSLSWSCQKIFSHSLLHSL